MKSGAACAICALMVLATALSGCTGNGMQTANSGSLLNAATGAAKKYIDSPQLTGIAGVEPFKNYKYEDMEIIIYADDEVGDGKAPGWLYSFVGGGKAVAILIMGNGGVLGEMIYSNASNVEEMQKSGNMKPIKDCKYNSEEVAKILKADSRWPKMNESSTLFWMLSMENETPVWEVMFSVFNSYSETTARINARTGTVISIDAREPYSSPQGDPDDVQPPEEKKIVEDSTSGIAIPLSGVSAEITIEGWGQVYAQVDATIATGSVKCGIEWDGALIEEKEVEVVGVGSFQYTFANTFSTYAPGTYRVFVSAEAGACDCSVYIKGTWRE